MSTMYFYSGGYAYDFFLDDQLDHVVYWWHENDAQYRHKHMSGLFELCGVRIWPVEDKEHREKAEKTVVTFMNEMQL